MRRGRAATLAGLVAVVSSCATSSDDARRASVAPSFVDTNPRATVDVASVPRPTLNLDAVADVSVPMAISNHLDQVQYFVRVAVGTSVFAGSSFVDDENSRIEIYATDVGAVEAALVLANTPLRADISVRQVEHSLDELEEIARTAQSRLDAAGIAGSAWIQAGLDMVTVDLETPDGQPDAAIETAAGALMYDLPVMFVFRGPFIDL